MTKLDRLNDLYKLAASTAQAAGEAIKKTPNIFWRTMAYPLAITGGAALMSYGLIPLLGNIKRKADRSKAWEKIVARNPAFDTEKMREQFEALFDLSPKMMKHPTFSMPLLRQSEEYDAGGIPVDVARTISGIGERGGTDMRPVLLTALGRASSTVAGAALKHEQAQRQEDILNTIRRQTRDLSG